MKKNYIPILLAFAAYCGNSAAAQDVYVYKGEGLDPVSTLKNVQRITFADAQIEFPARQRREYELFIGPIGLFYIL